MKVQPTTEKSSEVQPVSQRQWVGLTDDEIATAWPYELGQLEKQFAFNLEVKLKEKNNG